MSTTLTPIAPAETRTANSLAIKASSGFGWNVAGSVMRAAAGFGINLFLARLLGPEPFGLIALAMVVIALGNLLVDSGLGVQLIQKKHITKADVQTAFTLQLLLGAILGAALILSAPLIAIAFKQPHIQPIIRSLAALLLIQSAGQPSIALLRRELRFKQLQKVQIASYLSGYGLVGIPLGLMGAGVWTLVAAQLTQAVMSSIISWTLVGHSLLPRLGPDARLFLAFGSRVAGTNVVCWMVGSLPSLFIGRMLGVAMLGYYNRAFMLVAVPLTVLASSFQTVSLSAYSSLQDKHLTVRRAFLSFVALMSLAAFPSFLLAASMPGTIVQVLLGTKWVSSAPLLAPLALAMCFDAIASMSGPLLVSRGQPGLELRLQLVTVVTGGLIVLYASSQGPGLTRVAWAVCFGFYLTRATMATLQTKRALGLRWHEIGASLRGGLVLGVAVFAAAHTIDAQLSIWHVSTMIRLILAGSSAAAIVLTLTLTIPRAIVYPDLHWLLMDRGLPIPRVVMNALSSLIPEKT